MLRNTQESLNIIKLLLRIIKEIPEIAGKILRITKELLGIAITITMTIRSRESGGSLGSCGLHDIFLIYFKYILNIF